jgi:hypothetical protein
MALPSSRQRHGALIGTVIFGGLMKHLLAIFLATLGLSAMAVERQPDLPSCDLASQRVLDGQGAGKNVDPQWAHISLRATILEADIGTSRKARTLSQRTADRLFQRIEMVRSDSLGFIQQQGFLSAAERASSDRELNAIARRICKGAKL